MQKKQVVYFNKKSDCRVLYFMNYVKRFMGYGPRGELYDSSSISKNKPLSTLKLRERALAHLFSFTNQEDWPSLRLVCREWQKVASNEKVCPQFQKIILKCNNYKTLCWLKPKKTFHPFSQMQKSGILKTQLFKNALYVCFCDGSLFQITEEARVQIAAFKGKIEWFDMLSEEVALVREDGQLKIVYLTEGRCRELPEEEASSFPEKPFISADNQPEKEHSTRLVGETELLNQDVKKTFNSPKAKIWNNSILILSRGKLLQVNEDDSIDTTKLYPENVKILDIGVRSDYLIINTGKWIDIWNLKEKAWHKESIPINKGSVLEFPHILFISPNRIIPLDNPEKERIVFPLFSDYEDTRGWSCDDQQNIYGFVRGKKYASYDYFFCYNLESKQLKDYRFDPDIVVSWLGKIFLDVHTDYVGKIEKHGEEFIFYDCRLGSYSPENGKFESKNNTRNFVAKVNNRDQTLELVQLLACGGEKYESYYSNRILYLLRPDGIEVIDFSTPQ